MSLSLKNNHSCIYVPLKKTGWNNFSENLWWYHSKYFRVGAWIFIMEMIQASLYHIQILVQLFCRYVRVFVHCSSISFIGTQRSIQHYQWFFWCNLLITSPVMLPIIIPILTFIWLAGCCHLDSATQHICSFDSGSLFSMATSPTLISSLQRKATREF